MALPAKSDRAKDLLTLGPLVAALRPRDPTEDRFSQSGWQHARTATVRVFERPAGATGAVLAVLLGAFAWPFGDVLGVALPQAVEGGVSALIAYWLAPTVYATVQWLAAPVTQRGDAREALRDAQATPLRELEIAKAKLALIEERQRFAMALEPLRTQLTTSAQIPPQAGGGARLITASEEERIAWREQRDAAEAEAVRAAGVRVQKHLHEIAALIRDRGRGLGVEAVADQLDAVDVVNLPPSPAVLNQEVQGAIQALGALVLQLHSREIPSDHEAERFMQDGQP
jgi:hypothetical protein